MPRALVRGRLGFQAAGKPRASYFAVPSIAAAAFATLLVVLPSPFTDPIETGSTFEVRRIDGSENHLDNPRLGAAGSDYRRQIESDEVLDFQRPHPREVSNRVHGVPEEVWTQPDPQGRSVLFAVFGQFLSHDITLRAKLQRPRFVRVQGGDPMFSAGAMLPYHSNAPHPLTSQSFNRVTAWIDASMVYGSDVCRAAALRSFVGGRLRISDGEQLPIYGRDIERQVCVAPAIEFPGCPEELENENPRREPPTALFLAGDVRANENPVLLSLHTVFLREHNRRAQELKENHPDWTDEQLYQEARRWVGALLQAITYEEYLPILLGRHVMPPRVRYRPELAGQVSVEFAAAAFRFGHSQLGPTLFRNAPDGTRFEFSDVSLKAGFFATPVYLQAGGGPGAWLLGASAFRAQAVDRFVIDDLRNYMFGGLRGGLDVATINIAVGRETLSGGWNDYRRAFGLPSSESFEALVPDPELAAALKALYGEVNLLDPWVALLVESSPQSHEGSVHGETLRGALVDAFVRLRDGDRFFYEHDPALRALRVTIRQTRLSDVIQRNLRGRYTTGTLSEEVFLSQIEEPRR
ncbi:MAG: peroxidase family protein [Myxococcota bacterium]